MIMGLEDVHELLVAFIDGGIDCDFMVETESGITHNVVGAKVEPGSSGNLIVKFEAEIRE